MRALLVLVLLAGVAHADSTPRNAISIHPLALPAHGIALAYERDLAPSRFSLAGGLAVRAGTSGDYESRTFGVAAELRWWLRLGAPHSNLDASAMIGPFVATRLSLALTRARDDVADRMLGSMVSLAPGLSIGYRLSFFRRVELSSSLGPALRFEIDPGGRLPPTWTVTMAIGFTAGWLF